MMFHAMGRALLVTYLIPARIMFWFGLILEAILQPIVWATKAIHPLLPTVSFPKVEFPKWAIMLGRALKTIRDPIVGLIGVMGLLGALMFVVFLCVSPMWVNHVLWDNEVLLHIQWTWADITGGERNTLGYDAWSSASREQINFIGGFLTISGICAIGLIIWLYLGLCHAVDAWRDRHIWTTLYHPSDNQDGLQITECTRQQFGEIDGNVFARWPKSPFRQIRKRHQLPIYGWKVSLETLLDYRGVTSMVFVEDGHGNRLSTGINDGTSWVNWVWLAHNSKYHSPSLDDVLYMIWEESEKATRIVETRTTFLHGALDTLRDAFGPKWKTTQRERKLHDELARVLTNYEDGRLEAHDGVNAETVRPRKRAAKANEAGAA